MHRPKPLLRAACALVLVAGVLVSLAPAQPCPPSAPPGLVVTSYAVTTPPHAFTSIAGMPGTVTVFTGTADDNITAPAPFPFLFHTFDGPATTYQISANGFVDFNQSYNPGFFIDHPGIPDIGDPNGWASPWYDDLLHSTSAPASNTYMRVSGTSPNQVMVIEWSNLRQFPNPGACVPNGTENVTTQLVLHESGSVIEFKYNPASFSPGLGCWVALVAVENLAGTIGLDPTGLGPFNTMPPATDFVLTPTIGPGPPSMVTPTYFVSAQPPGFSSIAGNPAATVELLSCADDTSSLTIPIPFSFDFYTNLEFVVILNANGFLTFDNVGAGGTTPYINNLGAPATPNRVVAPFWDDLLHADPMSQTAWLVAGTAPNREFIAEWTDVSTWQAAGCIDTGTRFTFQAVLKEGSNDIEFRYGPSNPVGAVTATASIGLEDGTGLNFVDATGLGAANSAFPATNLRLDPCEPCGDIATFGAGCPTGGGTIPVIGTAGGMPTPGNLAFAVNQSSGTPSATAVLVIGVSKNAWGPIPLPLNLGFVGNPGCNLNVSGDILVVTATTGAGTVSVPVAIPATTAACSAQVFFQWSDVDLSLLPAGFLAMSRGLWVTLN